MIEESQLPNRFRTVIDEQIEIYKKGRSITVRNSIPDTTEIPKENPSLWLKIPDVVCVYVDMMNSTKLSAATHDNTTASAYQLFTETAVRLFHAFDAPYIDVRGDGAFALFNQNQCYRALAAAVTFKTFASKIFVPYIREKTEVEVGTHIGIDQKTVLVRKVGLKRAQERSDRQNEVWAGKPINMAAKLASISNDGELLVSERFYENVPHELVRMSCGCSTTSTSRVVGEKTPLWTEVDVEEDDRFDFSKAYRLGSIWCATHGNEYCEGILKLDQS